MSRRGESNSRPIPYEGSALPLKLLRPKLLYFIKEFKPFQVFINYFVDNYFDFVVLDFQKFLVFLEPLELVACIVL